MKTILCYGDSLTWGYDPKGGARFPPEIRWPGVVQECLGNAVRVVEEALNGRTTVSDTPFTPGRNGRDMLLPLLESHFPVDLVILMLGTNDLQAPLGHSASYAACGCWTLLDIVLRSACGPNFQPPKALLVAPPPIGETSGLMGATFGGRQDESRKLPGAYSGVAASLGVPFLDAGAFAKASPLDGVHLEAQGHRVLGEALAGVARGLLLL